MGDRADDPLEVDDSEENEDSDHYGEYAEASEGHEDLASHGEEGTRCLLKSPAFI